MSRGRYSVLLAIVLAAVLVVAGRVTWLAFMAGATGPSAARALFAAFLCGAFLAALGCGIAFYAFVREAGADWRRGGQR